jgi:hypothetical protein
MRGIEHIKLGSCVFSTFYERSILNHAYDFNVVGDWVQILRLYTVEPLITDTAGEFKFCP